MPAFRSGTELQLTDATIPARTSESLQHRRGISLLEIVLVLFIVAVMLSILVPGIRRSRETARRALCANNLKQTTLALAAYHDSHELFPPGYVTRDVLATFPADRETGPGFAWGALLLPYLDQRPLYNTINFSLDSDSFVITKPLSFFQCPSNSVGWPSSYVGSAGCGNLTERPGAPAIPGILYRNSNVPAFDIRDGTSNTFLVGERAAVHDFVPGEPPVTAGAEWFSVQPGQLRPAGLSDFLIDESSASLALGTVGQDRPIAVNTPPLQSNHVAAFSSMHDGGIHMGMADGSVHFISTSIDYDTYRALGGRKEGTIASVPIRY